MWFNKKKDTNFLGFRVFDFTLYTQNRKLGNLGKFCFTQIFGSI